MLGRLLPEKLEERPTAGTARKQPHPSAPPPLPPPPGGRQQAGQCGAVESLHAVRRARPGGETTEVAGWDFGQQRHPKCRKEPRERSMRGEQQERKSFPTMSRFLGPPAGQGIISRFWKQEVQRCQQGHAPSAICRESTSLASSGCWWRLAIRVFLGSWPHLRGLRPCRPTLLPFMGLCLPLLRRKQATLASGPLHSTRTSS